ncbi:MAG: hypothetical protein IID49_04875 [Proteobacteria bacterium]|nr:hypothetical protein [Pseudomonadota bacterium]
MAKLAEVATHLDLSLARVSQLKSAGILPDAKRGKHDLDTVRVAYIRHLRATAAGRSAAYGTLDLTAERAALARAQTAKVERENKIADGKFLEVASFHRMVTAAFARVRSKLLALPSKMAPLVAPAMEPAKAQGILRADIHQALDELATPPSGNWDMKNCVWTDDPITTEG